MRVQLPQLLHKLPVLLQHQVALDGFALVHAVVQEDFRVELRIQYLPLPLRSLLILVILLKYALDVSLHF